MDYCLVYLSFLINATLTFRLSKKYCVKERFHYLVRYFIIFIYSGICTYALKTYDLSSLEMVIVITVLLFIFNIIIYKSKLMTIVGVLFGCLIHYYVFQTISLVILTSSANMSPSDWLLVSSNVDINICLALGLNDITLIGFTYFVSHSQMARITDDRTLLSYITVLMGGIYFLFLFDNAVYTVSYFEMGTLVLLVVHSILFLLVFYIMFIFMLKIGLVRKYEMMIGQLEVERDETKNLSKKILEDKNILIELDNTQCKIRKLYIYSYDFTDKFDSDYKVVLNRYKNDYVNYEYISIFDNLDVDIVKTEYEKGNNVLTYHYLAHKLSVNKNKDNYQVDYKSYLWHELVIITNINEKGDLKSLIYIYEKDEELRKQQTLKYNAETDGLTGALNKNTLQIKIDDILNDGENGVLFIFDLDNFKFVNDMHGHAYGDELLIELYQNVKKLLRNDDIIGRFGGDEFVIFIKGDFSLNAIKKIADRICKKSDELTINKINKKNKVSLSVGVTKSSSEKRSYTELFKAADRALYKAKKDGKNRYIID